MNFTNIAVIDSKKEDKRVYSESGITFIDCQTHVNLIEQNKPIFKVTDTVLIHVYDGITNEIVRMANMAKNSGNSIICISKSVSAIEIQSKFNIPCIDIKMEEEDVEKIVEQDEELLEKYFDGQVEDYEIQSKMKELHETAQIAILVGSIEESKNHFINGFYPSPGLGVFKTEVDDFKGKLSYVRNGSLKLTNNKHTLFEINKGELKKVKELQFNQIGVIAKVDKLKTGDILNKDEIIENGMNIEYSDTLLTVSISAGDMEDKLSTAINTIALEDPTIKFERINGEALLSGMGQEHINNIKKELKDRFDIETTCKEPTVVLKHTIRKEIDLEAKHKKQSGGSGQFAIANIIFEPTERGSGFEFVNKIVGGAIDKRYIPSVESGIKEFFEKKNVVDIRATLHFGKMHSVDSSDMAFFIAGGLGAKDMFEQSEIVTLEPMKELEIVVDDEKTGDIMSDLNSRRGQIRGIDSVDGKSVIKVKVPYSEILTYCNQLHSMTAGQGYFTMKDAGYQEKM